MTSALIVLWVIGSFASAALNFDDGPIGILFAPLWPLALVYLVAMIIRDLSIGYIQSWKRIRSKTSQQ